MEWHFLKHMLVFLSSADRIPAFHMSDMTCTDFPLSPFAVFYLCHIGCFMFLCDSAVPPVIVKEWCASKAKSALTPELVPAMCFREWTCPNLRRLWLGRASEDRSRRTRAFLACMRSDCPALLNPSSVPSHLLLMCCVLR